MPWMYYRHHHAGAIRISGKDRVAFLQDLTTNDLSRLAPDQAVLTVLPNAAGRILDLFIILEDDDALLALALPYRTEATLQYLHAQRENRRTTTPLAALRKAEPNYEVTLQDESRLWDHACLLPGEGEPPGGLEPPRQPGYAQRFPNGSAAISLPKALGGGLLLLSPKGVTVMMITRTHLLSEEAYHQERIRRGIPGAETELTAEFSPFEVGLGELVALDKTDFPGRTLLAHEARNPDRGRTLAGLQADTPIHTPGAVRVEAAQVGQVTSATQAPDAGAWALAVVRRPHHMPGTRVTLHAYADGTQETETDAVISAFPLGDPA